MKIRSAARMAPLLGVLGLLASLVLVPATTSPARAATLGHCAAPARLDVFKEGGIPLLDWRENLEFDGRGTLWVAHLTKNRVEGYAPDGTLRTSVTVSGPGGIRRGPDGMMYVNYGVNPLTHDSGIVRFDPAAARPKAERFVSGLSGINGLAVDTEGNFYLSRELATGILKIRPDGTRDEAWTKAADVFGANGLTIVGDQLYASVITDTTSPIVRIPLKDPAARSTVVRLGSSLLDTKVLDDLTSFDGDLVVASFRKGQLLRVDPATGRTCVLTDGLRMPSSVRVARAFGDNDPRRVLFVVEASGRVVKVTVG